MTRDNEIVQFDPESESITTAIVTAVAAIQGVEPTKLQPLGERVDSEVLERLFTPLMRGAIETGSITFSYEGVTVTVDLDGELSFAWQ